MVEEAAHGEPLLLTYTLFPSVWPREKTERSDASWDDLVERIRQAPLYSAKASCPLISLAEYGDTIDEQHKCLRYAGNVKRVWGVEIDYDAGEVSLEEGARRLSTARIRCALYTSPSHTPSRPRWRVLAPLADPALPEKRAELVGRLNRALGGIATRESFTLSQSFYLGRVIGAEYKVISLAGRTVDVAYDLEPLYPPTSVPNGLERDPTPDEDFRQAFVRRSGRQDAMLKLSSRWAARGMKAGDIESVFLELLGKDHVNDEGVDLRDRAHTIAASAVAKFGETRNPNRAPEPRRSPRSGDRKANGHGPPMPPQSDEERAQAARGDTFALTFDSLEATKHAVVAPKVPIVEGMMFPGAWLITGRAKIGKSWLLLQLMLAVSEGEQIFGHSCPDRGAEVLGILTEDDIGRIKGRLEALGVDRAPANAFVVDHSRFQALAMQYAEHLTLYQFLDAYLEGHPRTRLVVIDTETVALQIWAGERRGDDSRVTERDYQQVRKFDEVALARNCAICLVNHSRKSNGQVFDYHELINRSGTAAAGASGSWVLADPPGFDPQEGSARQRVFAVRGRDLLDDVVLAIENSRDNPTFRSLGPYKEVSQTQLQNEALHVLEELTEAEPDTEWFSIQDIADGMGAKRENVKRMLSHMMRDPLRRTWKKWLIETKRGKNGGVRLRVL